MDAATLAEVPTLADIEREQIRRKGFAAFVKKHLGE